MNTHLAVLHQPAVQMLVLVLGAYRITRLIGWDDWPPIVRVRVWLLREYWVAVDDVGKAIAMGGPGPIPHDSPFTTPALEPVGRGLFETDKPVPGKPPSSEVSDVRPAYGRPTLAHLIHCPFCLGWWISLAVYGAWWADARWTLILLAPWALAGAVSLVAKQLDP